MKTFKYNDIAFSVEKAGNRWDVFYQKENGKLAIVGTGLFELNDHQLVGVVLIILGEESSNVRATVLLFSNYLPDFFNDLG